MVALVLLSLSGLIVLAYPTFISPYLWRAKFDVFVTPGRAEVVEEEHLLTGRTRRRVQTSNGEVLLVFYGDIDIRAERSHKGDGGVDSAAFYIKLEDGALHGWERTTKHARWSELPTAAVEREFLGTVGGQ